MATRAREEDKRFCVSRDMRALFSGVGGRLDRFMRGAPVTTNLGRNTFGSSEVGDSLLSGSGLHDLDFEGFGGCAPLQRAWPSSVMRVMWAMVGLMMAWHFPTDEPDDLARFTWTAPATALVGSQGLRTRDSMRRVGDRSMLDRVSRMIAVM